jgi:hypothetical protein
MWMFPESKRMWEGEMNYGTADAINQTTNQPTNGITLPCQIPIPLSPSFYNQEESSHSAEK